MFGELEIVYGIVKSQTNQWILITGQMIYAHGVV